MSNKAVKLFFLALLMPLSGCGTIGTMVGKSEGFEIADSVMLRARSGDFVAAVEAGGRSGPSGL